MQFYYAPMEGVVNHIYRRAHHRYFGHMDKYFAPFITGDLTDGFTIKDLDEILPKNNEGLNLIPQILTNKSEEFNHTANKIAAYGYTEINLNLGCPSVKVVSKNRGSGFLADREGLIRLLDGIFKAPRVEISIKTRAGRYDHQELYALMEIFNGYPVKELIVHPRIQTDMYRNVPNLEVFDHALKTSKCPVCYNGDIFKVEDYQGITSAFPSVSAVMLGRGLVANAGLVREIKGLGGINKAQYYDFQQSIYEDYRRSLSTDAKVLAKMKDLWSYLSHAFTHHGSYLSEIRKSQSLAAYEAIVARLFVEEEISYDKSKTSNQP